jgi:hypothetical protein
MEWSEDPVAIAPLLGVDVPDVIAFRFGFLAVLIETLNILLSPEVVPDLIECQKTCRKMIQRSLGDTWNYLLHGYLLFWITLSRELEKTSH